MIMEIKGERVQSKNQSSKTESFKPGVSLPVIIGVAAALFTFMITLGYHYLATPPLVLPLRTDHRAKAALSGTLPPAANEARSGIGR